MNKSMKLYVKAINKYNKGYLSKAIELCEESISIDINNSSSINLKGLLYYLKGDLYAAQNLWNTNYKINNDKISKKYLEDSKKDEYRLKIYIKSINLIKQFKIEEGFQLLKQCEKSDYNYININNYLALCYMKKGNYDEAIKYINKVIKVDKKNQMARKNYKKLQSSGIVKRKLNYKMILSLIIIISILIIPLKKIYIKTLKTNKLKIIKNKSSNISQDKKIKKTNVSKVDNKNNNNIEKEFPYDKVKKALESKNFNNIFNYVIEWDNKKLSLNEKYILNQCKEIINKEGIEYFYNKGMEYFKKKDYVNCKENLLKAYKFGKNDYLYSHIIYMLGYTFQNVGDMEEALKYYIEYDEKFSNGNYEDTVLYNLSILYSNIDKNKSKYYGEKLIYKYPDSMYNNSKIKNLINN